MRGLQRWWGIAPILLAALAALTPLPAIWVERAYSRGAYPAVQRLLTPTSNLVPFALFDVLIVGTIASLALSVVVDSRSRRYARLRVLGRLVWRAIVCAAVLYVLFVLVWGLNYRRQPLTAKLQFDARAVSAEAARKAGAAAVEELNALHDRAHAIGWRPLAEIDPALTQGFERVIRDLGGEPPAPGRPKISLLNPYFRRAGVDGMTDPYFLEILVHRDVLPFERPSIVAHEWAHLAGFADESEASFVGWLACLRGSAATEYSGWLFLYSHLVRAMEARDRAAVSRTLAAGPRGDLNAIAARYRDQVIPTVSAAGWRVYDRYLKANRVEAGAASYDLVVRLVLGARFGPDWAPLLASR